MAVAVALGGQLAYFGFGPGVADDEIATEAAETDNQVTDVPAEPALDPNVPGVELSEYRNWQGNMSVAGDAVAFELDGEAAPQAVATFVSLTPGGYFEGITCHRLTTAGIFVLQCGDPNGDGTGGPGYNFGPIENAPSDDLYPEGTIAMARRGGDDYSMGSQFFIVYQDSQIPSDNVGGYTVFGSVTEGLEAIKAIAEAGVSGGGTDGPPSETVTLENVSVE
ncbi:MAG: peptidylprolyl isomerase [Aquiluna sp.]